MLRRIFILLFLWTLISCKNQTDNLQETIPTEMQPNWTGIDVNYFPVKFGHQLRFESNNIVINAMVLDFNNDENGIWIGLCFLNNSQLFGRQIPSRLIKTTCLDLFDLTYLNVQGLRDFQIIDSVTVNKNKVGIGAIGSALNFNELKLAFDFGIEQRKKEQTPCNNDLTELNQIRECYFEIGKIVD